MIEIFLLPDVSSSVMEVIGVDNLCHSSCFFTDFEEVLSYEGISCCGLAIPCTSHKDNVQVDHRVLSDKIIHS